MNEYTASNGVRLNMWQDCVGWEMTRLDYGTTVALREFFQAEADERLDRWRDPEQPDFVVYGPFEPDEIGHDLIVIDERTGERAQYRRSEDDGDGKDFVHPWSNNHAWAARHWFATHPEPNPWEGAVEGEVWVLDVGAGPFPMICQAGEFRDHGGSFPLDHGDIKSAHRIYPPAEES